MAKNLKESATALLQSPSAQTRPDFANRAAACHLLAAHPQIPGFDLIAVWPGHLREFKRLKPADHHAMAMAILEAQAERLKTAG